MNPTPAPWLFSFNVGPTKALIVEADGSTIMTVLNPHGSDHFKPNVERVVRAVNTFDEAREALRGVIRVADRATAEFDRARAALAAMDQ